MANRRTIRIAKIDELGRALEALPKRAPEVLPADDALRLLARKIADAQAKGHDLKAIASLFAERGVAVSEEALKASLRPKKKPKAATAKSATTTGAAKESKANEAG